MDSDYWIELAVAACEHAGIEYGSIETIATWDQEYCANAVYRIGGRRYLKIFGPTAERQFHIERAVLYTLAEQKGIPAPRIAGEGERAGQPPYLILTEIGGATAEDVWDGLARAEQLALAGEFGAITAVIHRLPQEGLAAVERRFGGRELHVERYQRRWTAEIERTEGLSRGQCDELIGFLLEEAPQHLEGLTKLTHSELAHNHIYLAQERGRWKVAGFIDWADAMLGAPEWDVTFLWFWTFTRDREAMGKCLKSLYADSPPPERFARRCLAAIFHTHSMGLLWPDFVERGVGSESVVREMTAFFFPAELFGPPD